MRRRYTADEIAAMQAFSRSWNNLCRFWAWLIETGRARNSKYTMLLGSRVACRYVGEKARRRFRNFSEETIWMTERLRRDWQYAEHLAKKRPAEALIQDARPGLTRALRILDPSLAIIDAARIANRILDAALDGDRRPLDDIMATFSEVLRAQEEARCSPQ